MERSSLNNLPLVENVTLFGRDLTLSAAELRMVERRTARQATVSLPELERGGIAVAFARGDFSTPGMVHMREVPGSAVMAARAGAIRYEFRALPRGGEVVITTRDPEALRAIHAFLAFQRSDHRV